MTYADIHGEQNVLVRTLPPFDAWGTHIEGVRQTLGRSGSLGWFFDPFPGRPTLGPLATWQVVHHDLKPPTGVQVVSIGEASSDS